jgi:hypothetical protein
MLDEDIASFECTGSEQEIDKTIKIAKPGSFKSGQE